MTKRLLFLLAAAALTIPATALAGCSQPDQGPEVYCGTYRGPVKTSFNLDGQGRFATPVHYDTLAALLRALPSDAAMRAAHDYSMPGPNTRSSEEEENVDVVAYLVAVKPGEGDHDFHVILSDGPFGAGTVFMNVEVSGLPRDVPPTSAFTGPRQEIAAVVPEVASVSGRYIRISGARPVHVQGSLYFDGDHQAGCSSCPGPSYAKPNTVWEIHPVALIEPAASPNFAALTAQAPAMNTASAGTHRATHIRRHQPPSRVARRASSPKHRRRSQLR